VSEITCDGWLACIEQGRATTFTSDGRSTSHTLLFVFTAYVTVVQLSSAALPVSGTSDSVTTCPYAL